MIVDLKGKKALVCGSTQGIGLATAQLMAKFGASVLLVSRNETSLKDALNSLEVTDEEQNHDILAVDFTAPHELEEKLKAKLSNETQWDILINNTGGPKGGPAHGAELEEYRVAFNAHLICNQILVSELLPKMKAAGGGRIVNVISTSVKQPIPGLGVSNTIRGAVANWAKTLSQELGPFNITVNNVLPGATKTNRLTSLISSKAEKTSSSEKEVEKNMLKAIPLGRFAEAEEVGMAICYLCSKSGAYISGINLPVDGGRLSTL